MKIVTFNVQVNSYRHYELQCEGVYRFANEEKRNEKFNELVSERKRSNRILFAEDNVVSFTDGGKWTYDIIKQTETINIIE